MGSWQGGQQRGKIDLMKKSEKLPGTTGHAGKGRAAVAQARLILLVMINVAQLWILAATVEAALAHRFSALLPLVIASGICFLVTLSLIFWWRPASRHYTSSGYLKR